MKRLAVIPARGGSKRIPRKNIKNFLGKPIISYSIEAALKSGLFDEVMVSTDDDEIASVAVQYGASVPFKRSADNSGDFATTADVIREVLSMYLQKGMQFDEVCCIYPTAPFLTAEKLWEASQSLRESAFNCVYPVVRYSYPPQRAVLIRDGKVVRREPEYELSRSQDLEPVYHDAGQFYLFETEPFSTRRTLMSDNCGAIVFSELGVQDLDTLTDWALAEMKYQLANKI